MLMSRAGEIKIPILMLIGGQDPVIDPKANRGFFDRLGSEDKTLLLYPETSTNLSTSWAGNKSTTISPAGWSRGSRRGESPTSSHGGSLIAGTRMCGKSRALACWFSGEVLVDQGLELVQELPELAGEIRRRLAMPWVGGPSPSSTEP